MGGSSGAPADGHAGHHPGGDRHPHAAHHHLVGQLLAVVAELRQRTCRGPRRWSPRSRRPYLRVGGYNNDANTPDTFDNAQLDAMVAYARAIGAEPILQVPHLAADSTGAPATAANAAAMVTYANVTKGYGIKYFSIGNEPDLYDSAGLPADSTKPAIPGYTTDQYCASVTAYVTAMKAVDPTIKIVGPDLAYKYQAGNGSYDWLTPILNSCGDGVRRHLDPPLPVRGEDGDAARRRERRAGRASAR